MAGKYTALDIAKYIVTKCTKEDYPISNLQLQKILFCVQKESLQKFGDVIFDDDIEAWRFGPVVPNVYYHFCGSGGMTILTQYDDVCVDDKARHIIDPVVEAKRILNPWDLVRETHREGGAWDVIYDNGNGDKALIPIDKIKELG